MPIFDPARSICAVVCSPGEIDSMEKSLRDIGYDMERRELDLGADDEDGDDGESEDSDSVMSESDSGQGANKKVKL